VNGETRVRGAAVIAVVAGAAGSVGLTLYAGRHNPSRLLMTLFAMWVVSPFAALILAAMVAKSWSILTRATLYWLMLVVTLSSLVIYGVVALGPPRGAFAFVVVPPASWLVMGMVLPMAVLLSRRRSGRGD
jgi:hypothetical protein